jgi:hypothetical protein
MSGEKESSETASPSKRKSFEDIVRHIESPKKIKVNVVTANTIVYERHKGDVATYYVDPDTTTAVRPFYNNIRRDITRREGSLHKLGLLAIASLADNPPSNVPRYNSLDAFPVEVLYQTLKPDATAEYLRETAHKIAQVRLFMAITP